MEKESDDFELRHEQMQLYKNFIGLAQSQPNKGVIMAFVENIPFCLSREPLTLGKMSIVLYQILLILSEHYDLETMFPWRSIFYITMLPMKSVL